MRDRLPLYPGRVQLTPVSGQPNVYDMVRADQPTQEGDPLNKATFLQDAVAALFGKDGNAVPNDILQILSAAALYKIGTIKVESTTVEDWATVNGLGSGTIGTSAPIFNAETGEFEFSGSTAAVTGVSCGFSNSQSSSESTCWSYMHQFGSYSGYKYFIPDANKSVFYTATFFGTGVSQDPSITGTGKFVNANITQMVDAPQPGLYDVLGNLLLTLPGVQIETGSYVGTGTYGESNPNSLTFGFEPKLVIIYPNSGNSLAVCYGPLVMSDSGNITAVYRSNGYGNVTFSVGQTTNWYSTLSGYQMNVSGVSYSYIAIG